MITINKERLITNFKEIVKISSPSWHEEKMISYLEKELLILGLEVKRSPCLNSFSLIATLAGDKKKEPILFSGHLDTVQPGENITPLEDETKIYTDGTTILGADDKSAVAAFLEALRQIKEQNLPHGDIEFIFTCAEEVGLHGSKNLPYEEIKAKKAFVFDNGGDCGHIAVQAPFHQTLDLEIFGKTAHAGLEPEKGINAIIVLSKILAEIPIGRLDSETTTNVGLIDGGNAINIVPEHAIAQLEIRSLQKEKLQQVEKEIVETAQKITTQQKAKIKIRSELEYSGFNISAQSEIIKICQQAADKLNLPLILEKSGGGSDTNIFNQNKIEAVNIGIGMTNCHTTNEYILKKNLIKATEFILAIITTV